MMNDEYHITYDMAQVHHSQHLANSSFLIHHSSFVTSLLSALKTTQSSQKKFDIYPYKAYFCRTMRKTDLREDRQSIQLHE